MRGSREVVLLVGGVGLGGDGALAFLSRGRVARLGTTSICSRGSMSRCLYRQTINLSCGGVELAFTSEWRRGGRSSFPKPSPMTKEFGERA